MKLQTRRLLSRKTVVVLQAWPRIIPAAYAATPIEAGYGPSWFSSIDGSFRVLYAAEDFSTAFAEAVVRDRFEGKRQRYLHRSYLETLKATEITSAPLALLDITGRGAYELGIDTDVGRARTHAPGRKVAAALHQHTVRFDGVLFDSRLTGSRCVAVFDRGFAKLTATKPCDLVRVGALSAELTWLGIILRDRRRL